MPAASGEPSGRTLVTGASGFLGRLLVPRLLAAGRTVRVLERRPSEAWDRLAVERVAGDVTDAASLGEAMTGVDRVLHLAGLVSHREADRERLRAVNVGGVANVLAAAKAAGVGRIVHVSSVASVGTTDDPARPSDEESPYSAIAGSYPYSRSKREGEELALAAAGDGQDVVVVCPAFVIGAGDVNEISTFAIRQYLSGALRFTTAGGLSYVDARDVVDGILAAEARGRAGRRYILGTPDGNLAHRDFFRRVGALAGRRRMTVYLPPSLLVPGARLAARLHLPLPLEVEEIDSGRYYWFVDPSRAIGELGLRPRPVNEAIAATIRWYRARGVG